MSELAAYDVVGEVDPRVAAVFGAALRGEPCRLVGVHAGDPHLPVRRWHTVDAADRALLSLCEGTTLDVGCGPGRMAGDLAAQGRPVLGVDPVAEAVAQTRARGACAMRRSVFDPLPGTGRWDTVLLADGNIGIGGDPVVLLRRCAELLRLGGRVVCDLAASGTGVSVHAARLHLRDEVSPHFAWALVGPEALPALAAEAGLRILRSGAWDTRPYAVLER